MNRQIAIWAAFVGFDAGAIVTVFSGFHWLLGLTCAFAVAIATATIITLARRP